MKAVALSAEIEVDQERDMRERMWCDVTVDDGIRRSNTVITFATDAVEVNTYDIAMALSELPSDFVNLLCELADGALRYARGKDLRLTGLSVTLARKVRPRT